MQCYLYITSVPLLARYFSSFSSTNLASDELRGVELSTFGPPRVVTGRASGCDCDMSAEVIREHQKPPYSNGMNEQNATSMTKLKL